MQEPKKQSVGKRILMYVVGLVVAGVAFYGINYFTSDVAQAKPGDCASATGTETSADYKTVPCDSAEANVIVGKVLTTTSASCGGDFTREFTQQQRRGPDTKLCLVPKYVEGSCFKDEAGYPKVDCGTPAVMKVTKVVKDDPAADCGEANAFSFTEPKLTYCVVPQQ